MSSNHSSRIDSHLPPLDLPGGDVFPERSSNGTAAAVSDRNEVTTGARDGEQNTTAVNQDLAKLVWRHFENEIREILIEVQEVIGAEHSRSTSQISQRKQKRK